MLWYCRCCSFFVQYFSELIPTLRYCRDLRPYNVQCLCPLVLMQCLLIFLCVVIFRSLQCPPQGELWESQYFKHVGQRNARAHKSLVGLDMCQVCSVANITNMHGHAWSCMVMHGHVVLPPAQVPTPKTLLKLSGVCAK